jgi:type II secretory pathway pseudopilin PulG
VRGEEGMTIVEVMVAGLILVVGALGVLGIVDAATRNTYRAEQSQVVANVLQGEMEKLRQLPYAELALEDLPVHSNDPNHPDSRVSNTTYFFAGRNGTGLKPLVYNGGVNEGEPIEGGKIDPSEPFQVGNVKGTVYRYVVWDTCPAGLCADGRHLKRVIVSVSLAPTASGGADRRYQEVQSQIVDPEAEPAVFPGQKPGGGDSVPWTLWLTDTPCNQSTRQPLEGTGHPTHNTRGDCADGVQQGNLPGAPDLLWPEAMEEGETVKPDYSTDIEPQPTGDEGLQIVPGGACDSTEMTDLARGVATEPDSPDSLAYQRVHRWLSPPIPGEPGSGDVLLTGEGTLSLWTRTISGAVYPGRICAWVFVRSYSGETITDTTAINLGPPLSLHFEHFATSWPSAGWEEIALPLRFGYAEEGGALPVPPGSRLGLAVAVSGDTKTGLQFVYDRPSFDSRLELATAGALPPGA